MAHRQLPLGCTMGKFITESKNRFRCVVEINGIATPCYIASSCRLDNFVDLKGKAVLLMPTLGKNTTTKYTVCGLKYKQSYILLNSSLANSAVQHSIGSRRFSFLGKRTDAQREHTIDGYKADLYLPSSKTIIEIKSIITTSAQAEFGAIHSDRFLHQLTKMEELLKMGYAVKLFIVSLNPYVKCVQMPCGTELDRAIKRCISCGLQICAYNCRIDTNGNILISKQVPILE